MYRSTADIDILADIHIDQIRPLFDVLQKSFYVDERAMRDAVTQGRSLGVLGTSRSSLDFKYLRTWAGKLGVEDLLQKALGDVQEEPDL